MAYIVVEGGDKSGKNYFISYLQKCFRTRIFDVDEYWLKHRKDPPLSCLRNIDVLFMSEPTYVHEGKALRDYLMHDPPEGHKSPPAWYIAEMFSRERLRLYNGFLGAALKQGIHVVSSRNVFSSLLFQPLDAQFRGEKLTRKEVFALPGNTLAMTKFLPDVVINCTVSGATRRKRRDEDTNPDNHIYETNSFSKAVAKIYDEELPQLCKEYSVTFEEISLEGTHDETRIKAEEFFQRVF